MNAVILLLLLLANWTLTSHCSIEFGKMSTLPTYRWLPSASASSLQIDLGHPDRLLVTTSSAVYSISIDGRSDAELIAGNEDERGYAEGEGSAARFSVIKALTQLSESYYIVLENGNKCLRAIRATANNTWITSTFAGSCTHYGDRDGYRLDARFQDPADMERFGNSLFVTDYMVMKIKEISLTTNCVTTIYQTNYYISGLVVVSSNEFYVLGTQGVMHVKDGEKSWLVAGPAQGDLSYPQDIKWLTCNTLLVANNRKHNLQLIDIKNKTTHQICTGKSRSQDGNITECGLLYPQSLYVTADKIYIGHSGALRVLPYTTDEDTSTCRPPNITTDTKVTVNSTANCSTPEATDEPATDKPATTKTTCRATSTRTTSKRTINKSEVTVEPSPANSMYIIIGTSIGCGILLLALIALAVAFYLKTRRRIPGRTARLEMPIIDSYQGVITPSSYQHPPMKSAFQ